jgi:WD40 repeat protein
MNWQDAPGYRLGSDMQQKSPAISPPASQLAREQRYALAELSKATPPPAQSIATAGASPQINHSLQEECSDHEISIVTAGATMAAAIAAREQDSITLFSTQGEDNPPYRIRHNAIHFSTILQNIHDIVEDKTAPMPLDFSNNQVHFVADLLNMLLILQHDKHTEQYIAGCIIKLGKIYTLSFIDIVNLVHFFDIPVAFNALTATQQPLDMPTNSAQEGAYNEQLVSLYRMATSTTNNYTSCIGSDRLWQLWGRMLYAGCLQYKEIRTLIRYIKARSIQDSIKPIRAAGKKVNTHLKNRIEKETRIHHIVEHLILGGYMQQRPELYSHLLQTITTTHKITSLCFNQSSKTIAAGLSNATIVIYDAETSELLHTLNGHTKMVNSVCYSPDDTTLISGSNDHTIRLWDIKTGTPIQEMRGHTKIVTAVCYSPDGSIIASASDDRTVKLWNVEQRTVIQTLSGHTGAVTSICFDPAGTILISGSADHAIYIWDALTGNLIERVTDNSQRINCVCYSPDGSIFASASDDNTIHLYNAQTKAIIHTLRGHSAPITSICFNQNSNILISGSKDHTVCLWNVATGSILNTLRDCTDSVAAVTFSPNSRLIAAGSGGNAIRVWGQASLHALLSAPLLQTSTAAAQ